MWTLESTQAKKFQKGRTLKFAVFVSMLQHVLQQVNFDPSGIT